MGAALSPGPRLAGGPASPPPWPAPACSCSPAPPASSPDCSPIPTAPWAQPRRARPRAASRPSTSTLYQRAGSAYAVPWPILAAIGAIESDHGRSRQPGVSTGVNAFGCCAGPMQFNLRNGPPSTWQTYRVDGDADGDSDPYEPADAIPSAANYLRALLGHSRGDPASAVYGYDDDGYVADVLARARTFSTTPLAALAAPALAAPCADAGPGAHNHLRHAERRNQPRAFALLPAWAMAGGHAPQPIDARLFDDALWLLRTYGLRVTAAREGRPPHARRRHRPRPDPRRTGRPGRLGRLGRRARARPRLDTSVRSFGRAPRVPAGASDATHRLRGLPRPRLTRHLPHTLPRAPAHLLGLPVLRHQRAHGTVRVGDDLRPFARSLRHRRPARTRAVTHSPPGPHGGEAGRTRGAAPPGCVAEPPSCAQAGSSQPSTSTTTPGQFAIPPPASGPSSHAASTATRPGETTKTTHRPNDLVRPTWPLSGPVDVNRRRPAAGEPDSPRSALSPRQPGTS